MSKAEAPAINVHEDATLFREAVRFTAAESGFVARLIEKDYFCTVLLAYLSWAAGNELVFKGGTCLTKVHSELYRLSEDLDYTIPVGADAPRSQRSKQVDPVKAALSKLNKAVPVFRVIDTLKGANRSTQYLAIVGYSSMLGNQEETVKIEVSLREPLLAPAINGAARTILRNPLTNNPMIEPISVRSIDKSEALAEKFRAALSRRDVAIRDYLDIDHAVRKGGFNPEDRRLIKQVRQKLAVPGNDRVDVSVDRLAALRNQVESQLRPVLREVDFAEFNLARAFEIVVEMAKAIVELR
ncbi:MAG: nucleotidyl transferase AbiEii/AbiGii toxin family protein [Candidatus Binatia bacterium]